MIVLPWPPSILSGHANGNRRWEKIAETRKHRGWAKAATLAVMPTVPAEGDIHIRITFVPPNNRGDRTNYPNRMKPSIDGLAEALGVNDHRFLPSYAFLPPDRMNPRVLVEIGK